MRAQIFAHRVRLGTAVLLTAGVLGASPTATAQAADPDAPMTLAVAPGIVADVSATSARNAWAVGFTGGLTDSKALIERWNGSGWKPVAGPGLEHRILYSVAATSRHSAWAVGFTDSAYSNRTVILRWNGTAWKQLPSQAG